VRRTRIEASVDLARVQSFRELNVTPGDAAILPLAVTPLFATTLLVAAILIIGVAVATPNA